VISPTAVTRYVNKANVVTAAWKQLFGAAPPALAVMLAMAVAEFETHMGDAGGTWQGEHNWGAVHKRSLTAAEAAKIKEAGISPSGGEDAVRRARALLAPTSPNEALHVDNSPNGYYFVWFWAFPTDVDAAKKFLQVLVGQRPEVRTLLEHEGSAADVARAMYKSKYYSGVHSDPEANITDYARAVAAKLEPIRAALSLMGWTPAKADAPLEAPSPIAVLKEVATDRAVDIVREIGSSAPQDSIAALGALGILLGLGVLLTSLSTHKRTRDAAAQVGR
jgi:hypothetical protein